MDASSQTVEFGWGRGERRSRIEVAIAKMVRCVGRYHISTVLLVVVMVMMIAASRDNGRCEKATSTVMS